MTKTEKNRHNKVTVWALVDDRAGNKSQVLGVAEALKIPFDIKSIRYNSWAKLPNMMVGPSFKILDQDCRKKLCAPWPDLVIAAGRRSALVARHIKHLSDDKTKLVQIMYPGSQGEGDFSLIAVPHHDEMAPSPNRFEITGAPHGMTPDVLQHAKQDWAGTFAPLPKPHIAVIVGGSTKRKVFTPQMAHNLGQRMKAFAQQSGGSLLVTTSRRSTPDATEALLSAIKDVPSFVFKWGDKGQNPYLGYLALADHIVVTGDSVSMCCEAAAGSTPVYIYAPKGLITAKHNRLHQNLYAKGYAKILDETLGDGQRNTDALEPWTHPPLNAATDIAAEIRNRLKFLD